MKEITVERLHEVLSYNAENGCLIWKIDPCKNKKRGQKAGCIRKGKWCNYISIKVDKKQYLAHRLIWFMQTGEWPNEIDHINGNGLDNRLINLRNVSSDINGKNIRLRKNNSTGIPGVRWRKNKKAWQSYAYNDGKFINLINTKDFFEACCARKSAENKYGYHPNHGRRL